MGRNRENRRKQRPAAVTQTLQLRWEHRCSSQPQAARTQTHRPRRSQRTPGAQEQLAQPRSPCFPRSPCPRTVAQANCPAALRASATAPPGPATLVSLLCTGLTHALPSRRCHSNATHPLRGAFLGHPVKTTPSFPSPYPTLCFFLSMWTCTNSLSPRDLSCQDSTVCLIHCCIDMA